MHIRSCQNPSAITLCEENIARLLDAFQHLAIRASSNALRRKQSGTLAIARFDLLPRLFKPIATEIRLAGDAILVGFAEFLHVGIAEFSAHELVAKKWR